MEPHAGPLASQDDASSGKPPDWLTRKQLILLGLFPLSEHTAWASIFPYMYAMVKSISHFADSDGQNAVLYAALLVSCFTFGEFLMASQWAKLSDRIGRKPTLLIGSVGAIVLGHSFCLSTSIPMAIGARICAGMLNPNMGVLKTFVGELVSKDKQARGFSTISFMRGFGSFTGPIVGGYLANPTASMPSVFPPGSLWDHFPYLLPNVVAVVCLATSCTCSFFYLQEVHPSFRDREDIGKRLWANLRKQVNGETRDGGQGNYTPIGASDEIELEDSEARDENVTDPPRIKWVEAFTKQVVLQILSAIFLGFLKVATLALVPVFLGTSQSLTGPATNRGLGGGHELTTGKISNILLTQAIASLVCQILLVPRFVERVGTLRSYRITYIMWISIFTLMPLSVTLPGFAGLLMFMVLLWIHSFCSGTSDTCSSMMITNTAPSPIYLATINGVAASCSCLARTAGPATIGGLFSVGLKEGNVGVAFWALAVVALLALGFTGALMEHKEDNA